MGDRLVQAWQGALAQALDGAARRLSGGVLQLVFNLPTLGVLGYTGWLTASRFFTGTILSSDFFLHAFWTIALVLFLSFFLLQGTSRMVAGKERMVQRVFAGVHAESDPHAGVEKSDVWRQAKLLLRLGG